MHKILRYLRQNRIKVIIIVLFIFFVYTLIHAADNAYKDQNAENGQAATENKIQTDGTITLTSEKCKEVLTKFLDNCTDGNYKEAYNYLSEECKNKKYSTLEKFKENYCEYNGLKNKGYKIEKSGSNYTFKVEFNNLLTSGKKASNISNKQTQYYSITVDNGHDIKINID